MLFTFNNVMINEFIGDGTIPKVPALDGLSERLDACAKSDFVCLCAFACFSVPHLAAQQAAASVSLAS